MTRSIIRCPTYTAAIALAGSLPLILCTLVALSIVTQHDVHKPSPGARTAFQLLAFKPGKETTLAARALAAAVTAPLRVGR